MKNWDYIKKDKNSFYNKPEMLGHRWAKEFLDMANAIVKDPRLNKTKIQNFIINNVFDFDKHKWNYFNNMTKKDLAHIKHALKKVNKSNVLSELRWIEQREGMLRTNLNRVMHVLAYTYDNRNYLESQAGTYKFYGFEKEQAVGRAEDLIRVMKKSLRYQL